MDRTVENYQHRDLAAGRWRTMTLSEQLANIGSEFGRAAKRKEKGEHPGVFRELLRLREVMCDYFVGENEYKTDRAFIDKYFYDFTVCARR